MNKTHGQRKFRIIVVALVFSLVLTACGSINRNDRNRPYDNDGYLGTTNTNPNLPTSPTYHNYGTDRDLANDVLARFPLRNTRLMIDGGTITVWYQAPAHYTADDRRKLEKELGDELAFQLPRYRIRLNPN